MPVQLVGSVTVQTFPLPPQGFDPVTASPSDLESFGFPPRPDPAEHPAEFALWRRAFGGYRLFHHIVPTFKPWKVRHTANEPEHGATEAHTDGASHNWSGSMLSVDAGDTFSWISGSWTVPAAQEVPGVVDPGECVSAWLGIDGDHTVSKDVLQAGADTFPDGSCAPWAEWCPADSVTVTNLPVRPGQMMKVAIYAMTTTFGVIHMGHSTSKLDVVFGLQGPDTTSSTPFVGNCAEAIVERPSVENADVTLAQYDKVVFGDTVAQSTSGRAFDIVDGVLVSMVDETGAVLSVPSVNAAADDLIVAYTGP
jgi:hypothetical protein